MITPPDYHVHSYFSFDSSAEPEDFIRSAIDKGMNEICFTEHKDLDPYYPMTNFYDDVSYSEEIFSLREKYKGIIAVKKGIELDFQAETASDFKEITKKYQYDFTLASVHALEHEFIGEEFFKSRDICKAYKDYMEEVLLLSETGCFDVLGHFDYVKRFGCLQLPFEPEKYKGIIKKILLNLIKNGRGIEVNTSGWRHAPKEPYPSPYILSLYKKLGGEIITIGSDAHKPSDVGGFMGRAVALLKEIGFDGVRIFSKHRALKFLFM